MKRLQYTGWVVLAVTLLFAMLGHAYGLRDKSTAPDENDTSFQANVQKFTTVYDKIQQNYASPVSPDQAIFGPTESNFIGAIPGMLRMLDPHSDFFNPRAFALMTQGQEGKYFGVGMSIESRPGEMGKLLTFVVSPISGSPAFRAGIRPGDIIVTVNGKSAEGLEPSLEKQTDQVSKLLKGPAGTTVQIGVKREGLQKLLSFTVTRQQITEPSVEAFLLKNSRVGYVRIEEFNETTNPELTEALNKFDAAHIDGLILDLRGNPGGLVDQAVAVADHFLKKGQLIVYHYGRSSPEQRYFAKHGDQGNTYPIVVLINRMTASAAEIVTGALQDHDRALIMGQTSFGKGLVQTVFPLSDNTGMTLTTARYYTPSGRLIQRDYNKVSLYDYLYHYDSGPSPHTEVKYTDGGRKVYGGGGITPDVKVTPTSLNSVERTLLDNGVFFSFAQSYLGTHSTVPKDFQASPDVIADFEKFLAKQNIGISDSEIQSNNSFVALRIQEQIVGNIYGEDVAEEIAADNDPVIQDSVSHLSEAKLLLDHVHKYMAMAAQENH